MGEVCDEDKHSHAPASHTFTNPGSHSSWGMSAVGSGEGSSAGMLVGAREGELEGWSDGVLEGWMTRGLEDLELVQASANVIPRAAISIKKNTIIIFFMNDRPS